jgi:hypothetical protein
MVIEVSKPEGTSDVFEIPRGWPICDCLDLCRIHADVIFPDEHAKVLDFSALEFSLSWVEIQIVFLKTTRDFMCYFAMFFDCLGVNKDVVQIYR